MRTSPSPKTPSSPRPLPPQAPADILHGTFLGHPTTVAAPSCPLPPDWKSAGFVQLALVAPSIHQEIRYATANNFVGRRICGYVHACALLTRPAATALALVAGDLAATGLGLKVFDAYRPQTAVNDFIAWAADGDMRMKGEYYPDEEKTQLFPKGYLAARSGHTRGSTVDLTIVDLATGEEMDMGGSFDFFGERSHFFFAGVGAAQAANRRLLRKAMMARGFAPISTEWWHFTLAREPFPATYFSFPVSRHVGVPGDPPAASAAIGPHPLA